MWGKAVVGLGVTMGLGVNMRLRGRRRMPTIIDMREWLEEV